MLRDLFAFIVLSLLLFSCWNGNKPRPERPAKKVLGYKPVYSNDSTLLRIVADTARSVKNPGKIYAYGNLIFQSEVGEGIHVLDKSNPSQLKNLGFLRVRGNSEISIKGNFLYANSFTDLIVVNIENWRQPVEVQRIKNAFRQGSSVPGFYFFLPLPEHGVYYDCMQITKGIQTGWVKDSIYDHNCYYR